LTAGLESSQAKYSYLRKGSCRCLPGVLGSYGKCALLLDQDFRRSRWLGHIAQRFLRKSHFVPGEVPSKGSLPCLLGEAFQSVSELPHMAFCRCLILAKRLPDSHQSLLGQV
jgi:hypothetical protein